MINGLGLKAVISYEDFEKEMHGLGYPYKVYHLPAFEYREYGSYVPFLLTDEAIKSDYNSIEYEKCDRDIDEERMMMYEAQAALRRDFRTWVSDDTVLVYFAFDL